MYQTLFTMRLAFESMLQGEKPWIALGNFTNYWFGYAVERRAELVQDPLPESIGTWSEAVCWASFCAASVDYLCHRAHVPCPSWVNDSRYILPALWCSSPHYSREDLREHFLEQTPQEFRRRNIITRPNVFANKWDLVPENLHNTHTGTPTWGNR